MAVLERFVEKNVSANYDWKKAGDMRVTYWFSFKKKLLQNAKVPKHIMYVTDQESHFSCTYN